MAEETLCPKCNAVNPGETSFCSKCGTAIGVSSNGDKTDPFIGTFVGERFLVKRQLGEGGMGVVYEAEQTAMDRKVALKVLHPHLNDDELYVRFQREAAASSKLEHPNIITVYDFGRTENASLYIAMEFIDGKSLDDEIKQNGPLEYKRACRIGSQICSALRNAHDKNIIHRDMKPENVMLCRRGDETDFVKVLDFGIAKMMDEGGTDQQKALTKTGMVFGTPQYMSPEQVRGEKLDWRSDIYSVGIIVYEMLTGSLPFTADTPMGLLTKHLVDTPPAFATVNPNVAVPPELEALVMAALSKDAAARPQSMREFGQALDGFMGIAHSGKTTVAAVSSQVSPVATQQQPTVSSGTVPMPAQSAPTPIVRPRKSSPVAGVVAGVAVLLLAGAGAGWYFLMGPGSVAGTVEDSPGATAVAGVVPTAGETGDTSGNIPPGADEIQNPPGPESLSANPGGAELAGDSGPSSGKSGAGRINQVKKLAESGQISQDQLKDVKVSDETKKKIKDAAESGKIPDDVQVPGNVQIPDELKKSLAERLAGAKGGSNCIINAKGGKNATSIKRALSRKQAAIQKCIQDGNDASTYSFSISNGSKNLSGVSVSKSGNSAQSSCIKAILSGLKMVSASDADGNGTFTFNTQKSGDDLGKCSGMVKL